MWLYRVCTIPKVQTTFVWLSNYITSSFHDKVVSYTSKIFCNEFDYLLTFVIAV